jgi:hypothetical protein
MPLTREDTTVLIQAVELLCKQASDERDGLEVVEQVPASYYWQAVGLSEEYQRILILLKG